MGQDVQNVRQLLPLRVRQYDGRVAVPSVHVRQPRRHHRVRHVPHGAARPAAVSPHRNRRSDEGGVPGRAFRGVVGVRRDAGVRESVSVDRPGGRRRRRPQWQAAVVGAGPVQPVESLGRFRCHSRRPRGRHAQCPPPLHGDRLRPTGVCAWRAAVVRGVVCQPVGGPSVRGSLQRRWQCDDGSIGTEFGLCSGRRRRAGFRPRRAVGPTHRWPGSGSVRGSRCRHAGCRRPDAGDVERRRRRNRPAPDVRHTRQSAYQRLGPFSGCAGVSNAGVQVGWPWRRRRRYSRLAEWRTRWPTQVARAVNEGGRTLFFV